MRKPFKKHMKTLPFEAAHGGSGKRQLILSDKDPVSTQLHAMTKGYLEAGGVFDWHKHEKIDEFFLVLKGEGAIKFEDKSVIYFLKDDLIYVPSDILHRIENLGKETIEFLFIRINH